LFGQLALTPKFGLKRSAIKSDAHQADAQKNRDGWLGGRDVREIRYCQGICARHGPIRGVPIGQGKRSWRECWVTFCSAVDLRSDWIGHDGAGVRHNSEAAAECRIIKTNEVARRQPSTWLAPGDSVNPNPGSTAADTRFSGVNTSKVSDTGPVKTKLSVRRSRRILPTLICNRSLLNSDMYSLRNFGDMIGDSARFNAYTKAISRSVRPGDVVAEIGCGPAIFSLLACRAGAKRVYAIETEDVIDVARQIAGANGFADRVHFSRMIHAKWCCLNA
jgi:hypothetical protein